jgi:uncharacterized protein RhaS with RHS repeats
MAGHTTKFEHDSMRRMTKRIDALLRQTQYEYCKCGALEKVTDALGQKRLDPLRRRRVARALSERRRLTFFPGWGRAGCRCAPRGRARLRISSTLRARR